MRSRSEPERTDSEGKGSEKDDRRKRGLLVWSRTEPIGWVGARIARSETEELLELLDQREGKLSFLEGRIYVIPSDPNLY